MTDAQQAMTGPRMTEDTFREHTTQAVARLTSQLNSLQAAVHDIRLILDDHTALLKTITKPCEWRYTGAHLPAAACGNHNNTLMSLEEIEADFKVNGRRALYAEGDECEIAGAAAAVFFKNTHRLMRAKLVQGVLYARSGQLPVLAKTGKSPDAHGCITPNMIRYVLRGSDSCIWEPADDARSHDVMNGVGMEHRVALVHTLEGARVLVDWGLGKFSELPADIGLYLLLDGNM
jgi:hypothetical protein